MYTDIKILFGKEVPSVRKFKALLAELSSEEQAFYYKAAFEAAFCDWGKMNGSYRSFLTHLFTRDWQATLNFLHRQTVMGTLVYDLQEPAMLQRLIASLEGKKKGYMPSFVHLAFCILLVFRYKGTVEYFGDKLRHKSLSTDDLWELLERVRLDNEPGHLDMMKRK